MYCLFLVLLGEKKWLEPLEKKEQNDWNIFRSGFRLLDLIGQWQTWQDDLDLGFLLRFSSNYSAEEIHNQIR